MSSTKDTKLNIGKIDYAFRPTIGEPRTTSERPTTGPSPGKKVPGVGKPTIKLPTKPPARAT